MRFYTIVTIHIAKNELFLFKKNNQKIHNAEDLFTKDDSKIKDLVLKKETQRKPKQTGENKSLRTIYNRRMALRTDKVNILII